ncbi:MAG: rod shape-determining protein MreD [Magnetococcales bacterium]|nr:rod shape-determining protein MreD [Magnetococcales bacterium]
MISALIIPWFPTITLIFAVALQEAALPFYAWSILRPDLVLICLVYWRLYQPDRVGVGAAFLAGLAVDAVSGTPLGLNALSKSLLVLLVDHLARRLRGIDFLILLPVFLLLVVLDQAVQWGLMMLMQGPQVRWSLFFGRPLASVLLAPVTVTILVWLQQIWVGGGADAVDKENTPLIEA